MFRNETITDVLGNKVVKTINQCSQTAIELIIGGELVSICDRKKSRQITVSYFNCNRQKKENFHTWL